MKRFAEAISLLFHFIFIAPLSIVLIMRKYPIMEPNWNWLYPLLLVLIYYVIPLLILYFFKKMKLISDFDVTERSERNLLNVVVFGFVFIASAGLLFAPVQPIYKFNNAYTIAFALVFGIVTYFWKISYHMGALGWFIATIFLLYGINFATVSFAAILVIAMAWSRMYLKKHTLFQTVAGFSVSILLYEVMAWLIIR